MQQVMTENETQPENLSNVCVPQRVAMQAVATPDAIAIVANEQVLSYGELNRRANQLAHYLQALGVQPQTLVGLCVNRSFDMIIGLLGILKARAAYVPLDPTYPQDRLSFMLTDSSVSLLVTTQSLTTHLSAQSCRLVCLDSDAALLEQQSELEPLSTITSDDLAYVIYTSGSSGSPKGVQITHGSLLNLVVWHQRAFEVTPIDRATQITSPAFDATGWELWPYLTTGASIYLIDEDTRLSPALLRDWLLSHAITITFLPTALAERVMEIAWPATTSLRLMLTGADALRIYPPSHLPFALINNYGPTEATVVATSGRILPTAHPDGPPSIGYPIDNTHIYILNEQMQPVLTGEVGELHIGGVGLARGYLHRPDLTAEKFVRHPWSSDPDARLYKTGDLARILPDGQIAFIGRIDHQIKLRGYRIEPGEITAVLNTHPAVQTSIVVAREDTTDAKRLVAYLVLAPGADVTARSLQETLAERLPDYMLPSTFVSLDALPVTPNGKVDRAALPVPDTTNTLRDETTELPDSPIEQQLAEIMAPLLGVESVGMEDNFFMLGGHSLLGTQVIARVADTFGVALSLRTLFNAPTIRALSVEVEELIVAKIVAMSDDEVSSLLAQD